MNKNVTKIAVFSTVYLLNHKFKASIIDFSHIRDIIFRSYLLAYILTLVKDDKLHSRFQILSFALC